MDKHDIRKYILIKIKTYKKILNSNGIHFQNEFWESKYGYNKEILEALIENNKIKLDDINFLSFHNIQFNYQVNSNEFLNILIQKFEISSTQILLYYNKNNQEIDILLSYIFFIGYLNKLVIGASKEIHHELFTTYIFKYCQRFNYAAIFPTLYNKFNKERRLSTQKNTWYHNFHDKIVGYKPKLDLKCNKLQ